MASLETLPPDQRAVLQMVLGRGRGYDQIATALSIDRDGVRARAAAALEALGPGTGVTAERRSEISDYLLGQLDPDQAQRVRDGLAESPSERAWARVVASELAPMSAEPLPEIPVSTEPGEPEPAADEPEAEPLEDQAEPPLIPEPAGEGELPLAEPPAAEPADGATSPVEPSPAELAAAEEAAPPPAAADRRAREPTAPPADRRAGEAAAAPPRRRVSRLGGAILLGAGALIVAAVVVIFAVSGSSSKHHAAPAAKSAAPSSAASSSAASSTAATPVAQINLISPTGKRTTAGIAEVLKQGNTTAVAIVAQGLQANTKHDAYAVWLYNSSTDADRLGFVNPGVGKNGRLETTGPLPATASRYKDILISLETTANPRSPGHIVLEGALSGV